MKSAVQTPAIIQNAQDCVDGGGFDDRKTYMPKVIFNYLKFRMIFKQQQNL